MNNKGKFKMEIFEELKDEFEKHKNEEEAQKMSAYMLNKFSYLGLKAPKRREISKPYLKKLKKEKEVSWDFVNECWKNEYRELQYIATDYLKSIQKNLTPKDIPKLKKLIITKSWWDTIDQLDTIVGEVAQNYPKVNETLIKWSKDENIWLRRVAIDHQLVRKEKTNTELLEIILKNNFGQTEFFINKAIGWILRNYSKTNPEWVKNFIEKNRDKMAKLSIKEGSKYLDK